MDSEATTSATEMILKTTDSDVPYSWNLVLSALGIPHRIIYENLVFYLLVPPEFKIQAVREITEYFQEIQDEPQVLTGSDNEEGATLQPPTLLLIGALILLYAITGPWDPNSIWFQKGAGNSQAILEHYQWFRLVTALTLHANILHLLNNCILGGILLHFFLLSVGSGIGLFSLLMASAAGNGINVLIHGPGHIFVGFSTAIFAIIGMLAILSYKTKPFGFRSYFQLPLMGAFALLAMLGSAGAHTDLGAHLFGLLCGLLTGKLLVLPITKKLRRSFAVQTAFFLISLIIIGSSWMIALSQ
jgi:membrane associated rhomboid family serine protease